MGLVLGEKWREWIQESISTTSFSILVNGSTTQPFRASRGLRHPLSPFLFAIVAKALGALLTKSKDIDMIKGHEAGRNVLAVITRQSPPIWGRLFYSAG